MSLPPGLLNNRVVCALVSLLCLISSVRSWTSIARGVPHREYVFSINTLFLALPLFIVVSIAYRSSFWADRIVFGALAVVGALVVARALHLTPAAMSAVDVTSAFMWTIAGVVSLIVLARSFSTSHRNSSLQAKGRRET
jgi:hypothetical protein